MPETSHSVLPLSTIARTLESEMPVASMISMPVSFTKGSKMALR